MLDVHIYICIDELNYDLSFDDVFFSNHYKLGLLNFYFRKNEWNSTRERWKVSL